MLRRLIGEDIDDGAPSSTRPARRSTSIRGQLEQVLMNLVVNARDAMPRGGTLTIETANVELDDATRDAVGRPPGAYVAADGARHRHAAWTRTTQARIFEPFFTTKDVGQGHRARPGDGLRHRQAERRDIYVQTARPARERRS